MARWRSTARAALPPPAVSIMSVARSQRRWNGVSHRCSVWIFRSGMTALVRVSTPPRTRAYPSVRAHALARYCARAKNQAGTRSAATARPTGSNQAAAAVATAIGTASRTKLRRCETGATACISTPSNRASSKTARSRRPTSFCRVMGT